MPRSAHRRLTVPRIRLTSDLNPYPKERTVTPQTSRRTCDILPNPSPRILVDDPEIPPEGGASHEFDYCSRKAKCEFGFPGVHVRAVGQVGLKAASPSLARGHGGHVPDDSLRFRPTQQRRHRSDQPVTVPVVQVTA